MKKTYIQKSHNVNCAFDKWSIGWDPKISCVIVSVNRIPISLTMELGDITKDDLKALGEMFNSLADSC